MDQTITAPPGQGSAWCPLTGKRVFKSAHEAWQIYGQYRFSVSARTFQTYVGKKKACAPRPDGNLYVEDIELFAQSQAWPPAPSFVRGAPTGGEGEASPESLEIGAEIQREKLLAIRIANADAQLDFDKKRGELLPKSEFEQRLAAGAAIVGTESENFVYDNVREIIHVCEGNPEKEDSLREYLLGKVRAWNHAFSQAKDYEVILEEGSQQEDFDHEPANNAY